MGRQKYTDEQVINILREGEVRWTHLERTEAAEDAGSVDSHSKWHFPNL